MTQEEREPEQIREEIDHTREEMGETVEALAERADPKAQAQEQVEQLKARARGTVDDLKTQVRQKVEQVRATVMQKKDQLASSGTHGGDAAEGPGIAPDAPAVTDTPAEGRRSLSADQAVAAARENPVPVAIGALLAGFLLGRLSSR